MLESVKTWASDHEGLMWSIGTASAVLLLASILLVPVVVARLPTNYFHTSHVPPSKVAQRHPALHALITIGRNLIGVMLVLAGLVMLVFPGQGLISIVLGIMLMDLPWKHRAVRWMVARRKVFAMLNWIRRRAGRQPFLHPMHGTL